MGRISIVCVRCGNQAERFTFSRRGMCYECGRAHDAERLAAVAEVTKAIRAGDLLRAEQHACVDCGAQAYDWDHRDYTKPLDVDPVCRSCNLKRGSAYDSVWRPAGSLCPAHFSLPWSGKTDRRRKNPRAA